MRFEFQHTLLPQDEIDDCSVFLSDLSQRNQTRLFASSLTALSNYWFWCHRFLAYRVRLLSRLVYNPYRVNLSNCSVYLADDRRTMPGERIVGICFSNNNIVVYPIYDPKLAEYSDQPYRWVDLRWPSKPNILGSTENNVLYLRSTPDHADKWTSITWDCRTKRALFPTSICIIFRNDFSNLEAILLEIDDCAAEYSNISLDEIGEEKLTKLSMDLFVLDVDHLKLVMEVVSDLSSVLHVNHGIYSIS